MPHPTIKHSAIVKRQANLTVNAFAPIPVPKTPVALTIQRIVIANPVVVPSNPVPANAMPVPRQNDLTLLRAVSGLSKHNHLHWQGIGCHFGYSVAVDGVGFGEEYDWQFGYDCAVY